MNDDILIKNARLLPLSHEHPELITSGFIRIRAGKITGLGPMAERKETPAHETMNAEGMLVMPGLINTHTHAAMTLFRGLADDLPLMDWLTDHIFPAEAHFVNPEMVYWCSKLAAAEMIRSGTTTVADGYFHEDAAAQAFADIGLRAVSAQGVIDFPAPGVADPKKNTEAAVWFIDSWQKKNELITPAVFCHSAYTCSAETIQKTKALAREKGVLFFIHLAETKAEEQQIKNTFNTTPGRHLEALGVLDENTVCIHCNWLDPEEIAIMAESGARVVTCPASNMKLASGTAPVPEMLAAGIPVSIGTDSAASNNRLDMFREMDLLAKLHKARLQDPTVLAARQVLHLATVNGAKTLGLDKSIGSLATGKCADLIIIDLQQPHLQPFYNQDILVYGTSGADVHTVIINGSIVMQNRKFRALDEEEVMAKVAELSKEVRASK